MKNILLSLSACCFLFACASQSTPATTSNSKTKQTTTNNASSSSWSLDSISNVADGFTCVDACDEGEIMKVFNVTNATAKNTSKTACQVACTNQCFATKINNKVGSEDAAIACKSSLKKTMTLSK